MLACLLAATPAIASDPGETQATRETMQVIFENLRLLLQLQLSDADLHSRENQAQVLGALRELDDQAAILASHAFYDDPGGAFLASVLERSSLMLLRSYERDRPEPMRQLLYGITDICIACHTRLPSPGDSPVAKQFVDSRALQSTPLERKARIEVATRRFNDALDTLESLIVSANPADTDTLEDLLRTYLIVNVRVKGDMDRAISTLETVGQRSAIDSAWRRDVAVWIESLEQIRDMPSIGDPLVSAREIIASAEGPDFPTRRSALVEYIAASSLLNRYLVSSPTDSKDVSEAHYLLGLSEYRIRRDDWLPQVELYLEVAIVMAPDAPWAPRAYALMVEKIDRIYLQYPGGGLPPELDERLQELRQMIEEARPSTASSSGTLMARFGTDLETLDGRTQ